MNFFSRTQPQPPPRASAPKPAHADTTFPHGFVDFLKVSPGRRHHVGEHELRPDDLARFNRALRELSPEAPAMSFDQVASAAKRALHHHRDGSTPPFVESRMRSLLRLEVLAGDDGWQPSPEVRRQVRVLVDYRNEREDLIPDQLPVVGLLDDAVLVDVALELLHEELRDYEDFCRFRKVAAEVAGTAESDTGLTRTEWLEALQEARETVAKSDAGTGRFAPAPRDSMFHIG